LDRERSRLFIPINQLSHIYQKTKKACPLKVWLILKMKRDLRWEKLILDVNEYFS